MVTLDWLAAELAAAGVTTKQRVVFGSTVMLLHGIREDVGDVDLFVTEQAWTALVKCGWVVRYPRAFDPPLLEWTGGAIKVHAFVRWTARDDWMNVREAWHEAERVGDWLCVPLELVRRWKLAAHEANPGSQEHAKHLRDVALIDLHEGRLVK